MTGLKPDIFQTLQAMSRVKSVTLTYGECEHGHCDGEVFIEAADEIFKLRHRLKELEAKEPDGPQGKKAS